MLQVSNGVGAVLSFSQIVLKIIYRNGPKPEEPKPAEVEVQNVVWSYHAGFDDIYDACSFNLDQSGGI